MGMSSTAILFYGVTSQDDSDSVVEVCRRLELITDEQATEDGVNYDSILKMYLRSMNLNFRIHGSKQYPIVFFYPFDENDGWCKETLMRYFAEINPAEMKMPPRNVVQALGEIAEKLGYWGPNWKLVALLDI
jgi:hypothetical protein